MTHKRKSVAWLSLQDFQIKFVFGVLALSLITSGYLGIQMYTLEKEKTQILHIQDPAVHELVQQFDQSLLLFVVVIIVMQALALTFLIMYLTHKVAGPILRIQRELDEAIQTNTPANMAPVRKNDEFQAFFKTLKAYIDQFKDRL